MSYRPVSYVAPAPWIVRLCGAVPCVVCLPSTGLLAAVVGVFTFVFTSQKLAELPTLLERIWIAEQLHREPRA